MIHAYHSKKGVSFARGNKDVINVHGLPLDCLLIDGEFFFDVLGYLTLFDVATPIERRAEKANRLYRGWREGNQRKGMDGVVVATTHKYYSDLKYLTELTRDLKLVQDNGSLFTTSTRLEHEDGVIAIYRGTATPPDCVSDSKSGYTWDDFFEVKHSTLLSTPHRSIGDADHKCRFNVPVVTVVTVSGGIVKPSVEEDMPEVIKVNHPVNKTDVRKETLLLPVNDKPAVSDKINPEAANTETKEPAAEVSVDNDVKAAATAKETPTEVNTIDLLTGFSALVGQIVGGKKIKLTVTLELE